MVSVSRQLDWASPAEKASRGEINREAFLLATGAWEQY